MVKKKRLKIKCLGEWSDGYDTYNNKHDLLLANGDITELVYAPIMDKKGTYLCGNIAWFVNGLGVFKYACSKQVKYALEMLSIPSLSDKEYVGLVEICKTKYASTGQKKLLNAINYNKSRNTSSQLRMYKWCKARSLEWPRSSDKLPLP
jgi:hypothetical protein